MQAGPQLQATARRVALLQRAIQQNPRLAQLFQATTANKQPQVQQPAASEDPFAAIRRLPASAVYDEVIPGSYADLSDSVTVWNPERTEKRINFQNHPGAAPYLGKYTHTGWNEAEQVFRVMGAQRPGGGKYDTMTLDYKKDPTTGDYVLSGGQETRQRSTGSKLAATVAPVLGIAAAPLLSGAFASAGMGATTSGLLSNALVSTGTSALAGARGSDLLRSGLAGAVTGGIGAYGQSAGWNPLVTRIASQGAGSLISGRDPRSALIGAVIGQGGMSSGNAGLDSLLRSVIGQAITRRG